MIRFLSGANPLNLLILFFLGIILRISTFISPEIPTTSASDGWLYIQVLDLLRPAGAKFPVLYPLLAYLLVFIQAVLLNGFANQKKVFPNLNLIPAFAVIFLSALLPEWSRWSSLILVNLLLVWLWPKLTGLYHSEKVKSDVFNAGLTISICSFLYFPSVFLFPLILLTLIISRPFRLTEWLLSVVGLSLPYYFFFAFRYIFHIPIEFKTVFPELEWQSPLSGSIGYTTWVPVSLLLVTILAGILYNQRLVSRMVVLNRKIWSLNALFLIISLVIIFIHVKGENSLTICLIPAVFYAASFYVFSKSKLFPELTVWIGIGWILVRQFLT